jgi:hypothetical protein
MMGMILALCSGHSSAVQINYDNAGKNLSPTDLTVNNIHGTTGHYTFVKAYLSDNRGKPLSNKEITFQIEGDPHSYTTVTSTSGHALLYYYITMKTGLYMITADFKGDENYSASSSTAKLTVE